MKKETKLWIVQIILALLFLFSGGSKLYLSAEALVAQTPLPILLIRFVGVVEILGALGLVLPRAFKIYQILTPLAASGLVLLMMGAMVVTVATTSVGLAIIPLIVGLLAFYVAEGRWEGR